MRIPATIFLISCCLSVSSAHVPGKFSSSLMNPSATIEDAFHTLLGCHRGQKCEGLPTLKRYFLHFGYLEPSYSEFSNYFDEHLEHAVKTYQINFELSPTGELDLLTLKQLVQRRCGYPDIINGTTRMHAGSHPEHKIHALAHFAFFPNRPRWPATKTRLTYAFLQAAQLTPAAKTVFANAFARWSRVSRFTFILVSTYNTADIKIAFYRGNHGDGFPFDGAHNVLAHAFAPTDGRFHLDLDEQWVLNGAFDPLFFLLQYDLESVAVHEIGHLLGLAHSSVFSAIMYPSIPAGIRKVTLANDDILGIRTLYP